MAANPRVSPGSETVSTFQANQPLYLQGKEKKSGEAANRSEEAVQEEEEEGRGAVGRKRRAVSNSINSGAGRPAREGAPQRGKAEGHGRE